MFDRQFQTIAYNLREYIARIIKILQSFFQTACKQKKNMI